MQEEHRVRHLTAGELQALVRLLGDSDEETAGIAREKLMEAREEALRFLAEGVRNTDARIRARSRLLIDHIRLEVLKDEFRAFSELPDQQLDLETGALLVAAYGYPEVEMAPYREALERM